MKDLGCFLSSPRLYLPLFAALIACQSRPVAAQGQQIASDGAVAENALWEQGLWPSWWIEDQRVGGDIIQSGITLEDPSVIQQGITVLNWGFAKQASDGSFPGTAQNSLGPQYHSVDLFIEAAARAAYALKTYHPSTYALPRGTYASTIASYTAGCESACNWLLSPTVKAAGIAGDMPCTHRRWLTAATLAETSQLTGDSALAQDAIPFAQDGLSLQLASGWHCSLFRNPNGTFPPASLIAPDKALPAAAYWNFAGQGVNPEIGGYDVSYQVVGALYAERYHLLCRYQPVQVALYDNLQQALDWEWIHWIGVTGAVKTWGSTRVGFEMNHDGTFKQMALDSAQKAFNLGGYLGAWHRKAFAAVSARMEYGSHPVTTQPVQADGAAGSNVAYDTGSSQTWNIGAQAVGADFIQAGITQENEALIRTGIQILDWGLSRQASDGSFPGSVSPYYECPVFLEALARSILLLQSYSPVTYTGSASYYASVVSDYAPRAAQAAAWLTTAAITAKVAVMASGSTSRSYLVAAALGETAAVSSSTPLAKAAQDYAASGLGMQQSTGENPEYGSGDVNLQSVGILSSERYYATVSDAGQKAQLAAMINAGLTWELQQMNLQGTVSGSVQPNYTYLYAALQTAATITENPVFTVFAYRLETYH